jgi:cysteine desulfurase
MHHRYFDCNATTALSAAARSVFVKALDRWWYNASSLYREAAAVKEALEQSREQVADWLRCEPAQIIFTSGATESNNAVFRWFAQQHPTRAVAISALEHPSVAETASEALLISSAADGMADLDSLKEMMVSEKLGLVSLMAANNETGVLQPWERAAKIVQAGGGLFHCDAAQWIGKLPAADLGQCDFVTASGHKFGGPKGVGILKIPEHCPRFTTQAGGPQEGRHRAGTENVPAILAMVAAWQEREATQELSAVGRDAFEAKVCQLLPDLSIIGKSAPRLSNTSLVILPEFANTKWLARLSELGFAVSTGSACSSGSGASEVLMAMGVEGAGLRRVLRFSSGPDQTVEDWLALAEALWQTWQEFKSGQSGRAKVVL